MIVQYGDPHPCTCGQRSLWAWQGTPEKGEPIRETITETLHSPIGPVGIIHTDRGCFRPTTSGVFRFIWPPCATRSHYSSKAIGLKEELAIERGHTRALMQALGRAVQESDQGDSPAEWWYEAEQLIADLVDQRLSPLDETT